MMHEVLIMTMSYMHGGYCVTGIDKDNGEWVRLKYRNEKSFPTDCCFYCDKSKMELLDTIVVDYVERCPQELQPENVLIQGIRQIKGKDSLKDVFFNRLIKDKSRHDRIYYDTYYKLYADEFPKEAHDQPYSLMLIKPERAELVDAGWEYGKKKYYMNVYYNGCVYENLRVTDPDVIKIIQDYGTNLNEGNIYLVISLGELFKNDFSAREEHYKLVASIITDKMIEEKMLENRLRTIADLIDDKNWLFPIRVQKYNWTTDYYFVIEKADRTHAYGKTYKGKDVHNDNETRLLTEDKFKFHEW